MAQGLHMVFGGELKDPSKKVFRDVEEIEVVGFYNNYEEAYNAWKAAAQQTVDNAHMRFFIAHLHRLRDEENAAAETVRLD